MRIISAKAETTFAIFDENKDLDCGSDLVAMTQISIFIEEIAGGKTEVSF